MITGANKGIGLATVAAILEQYPDVFVILGSRDLERGCKAVDSLCEDQPDRASRLELLQLDVSSPQSVTHARDALIDRHGSEPAPLYGLVNNAGIGLGCEDMERILEVNLYGAKRMCDAFVPLIQASGRIVNIASASGPNFVSQCSPQRQAFFRNSAIEWDELESFTREVLAAQNYSQDTGSFGLGQINGYGFSKACLNLYSLLLARENPQLCVNACTPGYIETDLTRPQAEKRGLTPADMGMKQPVAGTVAVLFLLFGQPHGSGHYYGSDARRSPLDRYRAPGDPEYKGR